MSHHPEIAKPKRPAYPSDMSDAEWEIIEPLLPRPRGVWVTEANGAERLGALVVLEEAKDKLRNLKRLWVDAGYSGENFNSQFNKKRNILTLFCFPKHRVSTPLNALSMFWK
jgi:hypothetical protein